VDVIKRFCDISTEIESGVVRFQKRISTRKPGWKRAMQLYHGLLGDPLAGEDRITSNLIFGLVSRIIPNCYFKNPYPAVQPRGSTPRAYARLQEVLLYHVFNMIKAEFEARRVVFDSLFHSVGIGKVGMCEREVRKVDSGAFTQQQLMAALGLAVEVPTEEMYPGGIERGSKEDYQQQIAAGFKETVLPNFPYFVRVDPQHVCANPHATCIDDARWIAQRILMPHDEFMDSGRFSKSRAEGIQATYSDQDDDAVWNADLSIPMLGGGSRHADEQKDLVELWEVWYKPTRKVYTLSWYETINGVRKPLEERDWPYDFDEFPYEDLRFNPDPNSWFGVSDVQVWMPTSRVSFVATSLRIVMWIQPCGRRSSLVWTERSWSFRTVRTLPTR
jgi:hypothetical protein